MKSRQFLRKTGLVLLLVVGICFGATQNSLAATTVYLDMADPYLDMIASIQFEIFEPSDADFSDFTDEFPTEWYNFSEERMISAFDGSGEASLANGVIGTFDIDVVLGGWELSLQNGDVLTMGANYPFEYDVVLDGTDYIITNMDPVPVPSTLLLLGGGIIGVLGLRRKVSSK